MNAHNIRLVYDQLIREWNAASPAERAKFAYSAERPGWAVQPVTEVGKYSSDDGQLFGEVTIQLHWPMESRPQRSPRSSGFHAPHETRTARLSLGVPSRSLFKGSRYGSQTLTAAT